MRDRRIAGFIVPLAACAALAALASCARPRIRKPAPAAEKAAPAAQAPGAQKQEEAAPGAALAPGVEVTEASLRGAEFSSAEGLQEIRFDYDSATLGGEALDILKKNAEYLKLHPDLDVLVAGHCDERGTIEYNLALGQRRAKEVRDYYLRLGVSGKSVATISYGKESPLCREANEECWVKNRRAETRIRTGTAANGAMKDPTQ